MSCENCGSNVGSKAGLFLAGLGIGAVVALLLAPGSGDETREFLGRKADEGRDYVTSRGRDLRQQAGEAVEKAKGAVTQQKEQLSAAFEAGKQAFQDEKARPR